MMLPTSSQRIQVRAYYESTLPDKCTIALRTDTQDSYNQPIASWDTTTYTDIPCGFEVSPYKFRAREVVAGGEGTAEILVRCRMSLDYYDIIDQTSRIILTYRRGDDLTVGETFEVQGHIERGLAGMVINLKRVEP